MALRCRLPIVLVMLAAIAPAACGDAEPAGPVEASTFAAEVMAARPLEPLSVSISCRGRDIVLDPPLVYVDGVRLSDAEQERFYAGLDVTDVGTSWDVEVLKGDRARLRYPDMAGEGGDGRVAVIAFNRRAADPEPEDARP